MIHITVSPFVTLSLVLIIVAIWVISRTLFLNKTIKTLEQCYKDASDMRDKYIELYRAEIREKLSKNKLSMMEQSGGTGDE